MEDDKVRTPAVHMDREMQERVLAAASRRGLSWSAYVRDTLSRRLEEEERNG